MLFLAILISTILIATPVSPATPSATVPDSCPVTLPNGIAPPGERPSEDWHTVDGLSTKLPANGVFSAMRESDGGWSKHGWFPITDPTGFDVSFAFVGQRTTDGSPTAGLLYPVSNPDGPGMAWALHFPEAGCWTITGATTTASISFTTWVVFIDNWTTPAG